MIYQLSAYCVDVTIILSAFYACYLLFFRRTSFFVLNRAYLLITLSLAFAIPLLEIPDLPVENVFRASSAIIPGNFSEGSTRGVPTEETGNMPRSFSILHFLVAVYLLGAFARILMIVRDTAFVMALSKSSKRFIRDGHVFYHSSHCQPFCFI